MSDMGIEEANNIEFTLELIELKLRGNGTLPAVASLQSSGTQYINTGLIPTTNIDIEIVASAEEVIDTLGAIFGWRTTDISRIELGVANIEETISYFYMFIPSIDSSRFILEWDEYYTIKLSIRPDKQTVEIKDSQGTIVCSKELTQSATFDNSGTLFLYACNNNGTASRKFKGSINACKIWQDGKLVRDYEPSCTYDSNNVKTACLYDNVTQTAYYNAGTGDFIYN